MLGYSRPDKVNENVNPREGSLGSRTVMKATSPLANSYASPLSTSRSRALLAKYALARSWARPAMTCARPRRSVRSEEHTSELQSRPHLVCRLLLEKKKE